MGSKRNSSLLSATTYHKILLWHSKRSQENGHVIGPTVDKFIKTKDNSSVSHFVSAEEQLTLDGLYAGGGSVLVEGQYWWRVSTGGGSVGMLGMGIKQVLF